MRRDGLPAALLVAGVAALALLALTHSADLRGRSAEALGRGMPSREAELARGFVLGLDDRVDRETAEDFRRSGLTHLLAVSGQNVALLALLAMPVLAAFGLPLRARLVWVLGLIAAYVPLAGAGPSIQRAATMGALSVVATLAGRPSQRLHALALAAIVTLAVQPAIGSDVGWQLSFAAVAGILLLAAPLRRSILARIGSGGWRRTIAEGAAMTTAATFATAPLIAFHFGAVSTTTLLANLLALPAIAPAMWLGMLAAAAGQIPGFPVEAVNAVNAPLIAYIAQVAAWCGRPGWAYAHVRLSAAGLLASYLSLVVALAAIVWLARRHRIAALRKRAADGPKTGAGVAFSARKRRVAASLGVLALVTLTLSRTETRVEPSSRPPEAGLRVSVLDVGQGDAILLQPARGDALIVDAGPPGAELTAKLDAAGVERLGAAIVTHDQSDHAGGIAELLGAVPLRNLLYGVLDRHTIALAAAAGTAPRRIAAGDRIRSGALRLDVLWPPPELLAVRRTGEDPNRLALVLLLRWRDFSMLLSADAEAEATPLAPGPLDVLKVAHHGSADAGLDELLGRTGPKLAIVSVGAGNSFGHPTPITLATLAGHGVRTLRTDREGTVVISVRRGSFQVATDEDG
jgi:competence protein ComEC